jgi:hypothetical protein
MGKSSSCSYIKGSVVYPTFTLKLASLHHFCYNTSVSRRQEGI